MDIESAIAHGVSALAGAGGGGFFLRFIVKSWGKRQDRQEKILERLTEAVVRLDERVKSLLDRDKTMQHAIDLAVLKERADKGETDINNLGAKLRGGAPRRGPG